MLLATSQLSAQAAKQTHPHPAAATGEIPETQPEMVGFSSERLAKTRQLYAIVGGR
jgi:hypothetical protein